MTTTTPMVSRRTAVQMIAMKILFFSLTMFLTPLEELPSKLALVELDICSKSENIIVSSSASFVSFKEGTSSGAWSHCLLFFSFFIEFQKLESRRVMKSHWKIVVGALVLTFTQSTNQSSINPSVFFSVTFHLSVSGSKTSLTSKELNLIVSKSSSPFDYLRSFPRF